MSIAMTIAHETMDLNAITFRDVSEGDTVAHLAVHGDGRQQIWVGVAKERGISEWWGDGRRYAVLDPYENAGAWSEWTVDTREMVCVAATFHDGFNNSDWDSTTHYLFRVM